MFCGEVGIEFGIIDINLIIFGIINLFGVFLFIEGYYCYVVVLFDIGSCV